MLPVRRPYEEQDRLAHRLLAAVDRGHVRRVRALLALGADPNWPATKGFLISTLPGETAFYYLFPLALAGSIAKIANRIPIVNSLISAGADLKLALAWLSVEPLLSYRLESAISLCEVMASSKVPKGSRLILRAWANALIATPPSLRD